MCIFNICSDSIEAAQWWYMGLRLTLGTPFSSCSSCLLLLFLPPTPRDLIIRLISRSVLSIGVKLSVDCCCVASLCVVLLELA